MITAYYCKKCEYYTFILANYKIHIDSKKHIKNVESDCDSSEKHTELKKIKLFICEFCNNVYMSNRTLKTHQMKCNDDNTENLLNEIEELKQKLETKTAQLTNIKKDMSGLCCEQTISTTNSELLKNHKHVENDSGEIISGKKESQNLLNSALTKTVKQKIPESLKIQVWDYWIGKNIGLEHCLCCRVNEITQRSFVCGHIESEYNGGSLSVSNLKPICANCNSSMGTTNMNEFIEKYQLNKHKTENVEQCIIVKEILEDETDEKLIKKSKDKDNKYVVKKLPDACKLNAYYCKRCKYKTTHLSHFKDHMKSKTHAELTKNKNINKDDGDINYQLYKKTIYICDTCGAIYSSKQLLLKHKDACTN